MSDLEPLYFVGGLIRTSGEQSATPASNGDDRRAAPSHANCCPISAIESAVPMAVAMNLRPETSIRKLRALTSVPSGRVARESISKHPQQGLYSQLTICPSGLRTISFTRCITCFAVVGHVWQRYAFVVRACAFFEPPVRVMALSNACSGLSVYCCSLTECSGSQSSSNVTLYACQGFFLLIFCEDGKAENTVSLMPSMRSGVPRANVASLCKLATSHL